MYPRVVVNKAKFKQNLKVLMDMMKENDITPFAVTKVVSADLECAKMITEAGFKYFADSRIQNLEALKDLAPEKVLLRIPMHSEVEEVIKWAHISLNSEISTIELLNKEAKKQGKKHRIILMFDMGDLREGFFFKSDYMKDIVKIKDMANIEIFGVGTNLTCYGGVIPEAENLGNLVKIKSEIEAKLGIKIPYVSGGNSSSLHLLMDHKKPEGINNLRLGESLYLGKETAFTNVIPGTSQEAFILEAQIVEVKEKPSAPIGRIGVDAFGEVPVIEDRGMIIRAIAGVGRQDANPTSLIPMDPNIVVIGGSSDHVLLDVTKANIKVGDIVKFRLEYGTLLSSFTSKYVKKVYQ